MKVNRKIIEIDEERCDGCGNCVIACAEGALKIIDGKARVISDNLCDGLGACIGDCPQDALKIIEREAEDFDEAAVEKHLESQKAGEETESMPCGCPSSQIRNFAPADGCQGANTPKKLEAGKSALSHWPVQIRLIPPTAPFLKGADLLVVADCVPVAFPNLHCDYLEGKTVMVGCPKFDDAQAYIDKFAEIFDAAGVNSVTTMIMEVPCCSGLPMIVKKGMEKAGVDIPTRQVTISTRGEVLEEQ
ncbi:4Fe-4S ferredoxin [Desulfosarcina alkanivorans]|uniref:4Fe-4S ferredoxin n=1 Tax=Desulfosarcina alkanivorans TaxID=571177 RepID=A0A5K7YZ96_9BACT|nr:4Fe-4S binding protein [Desulfosarcina alkanivorans]BBO71584.1 4Fe-4S ferredoxin [Desulfosarcina alkanivorans]